ncbi:MAG: hypothetical protein N4A64_08445 [Marinisporobacter sp.]|nr:hypothetical protein [Marinisporobacter sp.]
MSLPQHVKHDFLLVIISMLFILFVTGCGGKAEEEQAPIVLP